MDDILKERPPLGVTNYNIVAGDRISKLAEAIIRHASFPDQYSRQITLWAKEIVYQCGLVDYLSNEEKVTR